MASNEDFTPLNMIKTYKEGMKVRVQVFILWHQRYVNNPTQVASVEMILLDHEGNKIVGSVRPFMYPDFQETLLEGNYVDITNFGVDPYKGDYRLIDHEAKLVLFRTSKVRRCPAFEPAGDPYNFVRFNDINNWNVTMTFGFDVIGHLVASEPMNVRRTNRSDKINKEFYLQDTHGEKIYCNVWGEHAEALDTFINNNKHSSDHVIIWLQNARLKDYKKMPQVGNHFSGARLHINSNVLPIVEYKKKILHIADVDVPPTQLSSLAHATVIKSAVDDYTRDVFKTVDEVRSTQDASYCVIKITITNFLLEEGWFWYSCNTCNKKATRTTVDSQSARLFDCKVCGRVTDVTGKVRTTLRGQDVTGPISLVFFDGQLSKLLNRSISWLKGKLETIDDPKVIPYEFNAIVDKEIVVKIYVGEVNLKHGYPGYTVSRGTTDPNVLAAIDAKPTDAKKETDMEDSSTATPIGKIRSIDEHHLFSPEPAQLNTPVPFSLKRKSESPPDEVPSIGSTSVTGKGLERMKISKMSDI